MEGQVKAHVWWSIYVRTSSESELREVHLPPITAALERIEFDWDISTEPENVGLFRLVTCQNFEGVSLEDVVASVLRRAYRLANVWTISGLEALATGELKHVNGHCRAPSSCPPCLESLVFDIEPGHIRRASRNEALATGWSMGAWKLKD